jgi:hypothetical protein
MGAFKFSLFVPTNEMGLGKNKSVSYLEELLEIVFLD